ncbi:MAG: nuclear transport factor 2 family protein [Candidatus Hydrogenedentes bacterium]|nr:nuclear transport factor 2 family protein [Candidatus Hydrogenedentota bacterium]
MKMVRRAVPVVAMALVLALGGCASFGKGVSDKDRISKTLADWKTALEANSIDNIMLAYSEDFKGEQGGKAEVRKFIQNYIEKGTLKSAKVDTTKVNIDIKRDTATVTPVYVSASEGSVTGSFIFKKEKDKVWRIVNNSFD